MVSFINEPGQKKNFGGGAQWEKSNKFVPLGKMKKIIFEN
jgi:hypothetical protein